MNNYLQKKRHNKFKENLNYKSHILRFGTFGIKSLGYGLFTESKLDLLNKFLNKQVKIFSKNSNPVKFWNLIQMTSTLTALSPESRMGKGKGLIQTKSSYVKPGTVLFEFSGLTSYQAILLHRSLKSKFSFNTKLIKVNK